MKMKNFILYSVLLISTVVLAQEKDKALSKANEEYKEKKYYDAEANFRISQSRDPKKAIATYNLGNAIYQMKQPGEAKFVFAKAIENAQTKTEKHKAFHNLGNSFMHEKNYGAAVEAYKNALRNNPTDEETRYNYALAKEYLKNNPEKNKDDKDKDKDKKDKDKGQKDGGNDKDKGKGDGDKDKGDNGDNKDDKGENGDKKDKGDKGDQDQSKSKPQEAGISKQRLENLLEAVNNEEKKIQDKINAQKVKGKPVQTEKDW